MPTLVPRFLLRAPLLPVSALERPAAEVFRDPLAAEALALASPDLAAHGRGAAAARALGRYARRAAFRPTPHGLWAGVAVGELGARTAIRTGRRRVHRTASWGALAALGRARLDEPELRERARLRRAPSLLSRGGRLAWLARGEGAEAAWRAADVDEVLAAVLVACEAWSPWPAVRAAAGAAAGGADEVALDELLLSLVDDGLLAHDLEPPLVGPPPAAWMRERLARAGAPPDLPEDAALLLHAPATATLARAAVERAAALAPVLFRVQDALAPPAAERDLDASLADALDAVTEPFGAGAFDLAALAIGDYGAPLGGDDAGEIAAGATPPAAGPLLARIVERLLEAEDGEARFTAAELDALAPPARTPPTFELVLAPCREPRGAPPGEGWLLGLHAPAGASWGRFAHALPGLAEALATLAAAEPRARPGEAALDVVYAPSAALADLTAHPPVRRAALALTSWPDGPALTPLDLRLVADAAAPEPLALRTSADRTPVRPSPLWRVRSTTAPAGVFQLLAGWSLYRQHAPWALHLGPLAGLARLPRIVVDGFVVAPASWRIPDEVVGGGRAALRRWRRAAGVPRRVQIGHEDELLLVDLDALDAADELARLAAAPAPDRPRAWEVWPPLDRLVDAGRRRVEAVVAVVADPEPTAEAAIAVAARAGDVPAPPELSPAPGWRTFKLFGAGDRADEVLVGAVRPAVRAARLTREIDAWFFQRYVDPPGRREHLRLRVHGDAARFERRLQAALEPALASADVVAVESGPYLREVARWGQAAAAVERVFESDSELVCDLIETEGDADATELLVRALDALAAGLGLDLAARGALAARLRAPYAPELEADADALAREFRARKERLAAALDGRARDAAAPALEAHRRRLAGAREAAPALPALCHLACVRFAGPRRAEEARAYYLWDRALESVRARRRR